ncbi:MAG TPA: hypothetical protein VKK81_06160 [Candidatus Binatia bacterium]|nr:hypothetical protein [Candidatus Binatia bacterium]
MQAQQHQTSSSSLLLLAALPECGDALGAASTRLLAAAVLPVQFFSISDRSYKDRGEVALMRAVLEDALNCVAKQSSSRGRRPQRLAREAEAWIFADDDHWPFAFVNICTVLGLDPGYVRRGLTRWCLHRRTAPPGCENFERSIVL